MRHFGMLLVFPLLLSPGTPIPQGVPTNDFRFGKVDQQLLQEANQLDLQFEKRGLVHYDPEAQAVLDEVISFILAGEPILEQVNWQVKILRDPMVNAQALPNGSIYLNTGLLSVLENEAQLAGVLAHEILHVRNRHAYMYYRNSKSKIAVRNILVGAGIPLMATGTMLALASLAAAQVSQTLLELSLLGYSREQEQEADIWAIERLAAVGFDPQEMVGSLRLLDERLESEPIETFYRSHPKLADRLEYSTRLVQSLAKGSYRSVSKERYLSAMQKVIRLNIQFDIDSGRFRTAFARAAKLTEFRPQDVDNLYWLGEAYKILGPQPAQVADLCRTSMPMNLRKNWHSAEASFRQVLALNPDHANAHRGLGMLYEGEQRLQEAIDEYRMYVKLAPSAIDIQRIKARLDALEKRVPDAR